MKKSLIVEYNDVGVLKRNPFFPLERIQDGKALQGHNNLVPHVTSRHRGK